MNKKILKKENYFIIESGENFSHGILGITASKITEKYNCPCILLQEKNGVLSGSGRSINNFSILNAIESCKDLLISYGGHEKACGLKLKKENLEDFKKRIIEYTIKKNDGKYFEKDIIVDLELKENEINKNFIKKLELLEPYGNGNREPLLMSKNIKINEIKQVGKTKGHLFFNFEICGKEFKNNPFWNKGEEIEKYQKIRNNIIIYNLFLDNYLNFENVKLNLKEVIEEDIIEKIKKKKEQFSKEIDSKIINDVLIKNKNLVICSDDRKKHINTLLFVYEFSQENNLGIEVMTTNEFNTKHFNYLKENFKRFLVLYLKEKFTEDKFVYA